MLTVAQLAPIKDRDPYLYETLAKIVSAVNATSVRSGVDPATPALAPTQIASLSVQPSNGWFDISIADPSNARPGLFYFAESDVTPGFNSPRVYFLGASRNLYVQLGNQTLYWRAYSQRSEEHTSELQSPYLISYAVFFFNDTATTEIYTLSLHDALPISACLFSRGLAQSLRAARQSDPLLARVFA